MAANVIFMHGTREQFDRIPVKDSNTLYWIEDEKALYRGNDLYGTGREATRSAAGLLSAEDKKRLDELAGGGISTLTAVDGSLEVTGEGYSRGLKVRISGQEHNGLTLEEDGLFAAPPSAGSGLEAVDRALALKLDQEKAGGLSVTEKGLALEPVTAERPGAMTAEDKAFLDAIPVLYEGKKYEVVGLLAGCRADVYGREIRVFFPEDAPFKQPSGEANGRDDKNYYFGVRFFAPDGAVKFKEGEKAADGDFETFDGSSSGTDKYGRHYDVCWFPAARTEDEGHSWTYNGAGSEPGRCAGWYHTIEWYGEDEKPISSETVRVNLTNDGCHNSLKPSLGLENTAETLVWQEMV